MWFRRNRFVHDEVMLSPENTVNWATSFLAEVKAAVVSSSRSRPLSAVRWMLPSPSWFKINLDATLDVRNGRTSFGIVVRNDVGRAVLSCAAFVQFLGPPDVAKAMALLCGVQLVLEYGFQPFCC
ncbi:hypothetical protein ACOSQ3_031898 [Xanthoceras sorbifolium]